MQVLLGALVHKVESRVPYFNAACSMIETTAEPREKPLTAMVLRVPDEYVADGENGAAAYQMLHPRAIHLRREPKRARSFPDPTLPNIWKPSGKPIGLATIVGSPSGARSPIPTSAKCLISPIARPRFARTSRPPSGKRSSAPSSRLSRHAIRRKANRRARST